MALIYADGAWIRAESRKATKSAPPSFLAERRNCVLAWWGGRLPLGASVEPFTMSWLTVNGGEENRRDQVVHCLERLRRNGWFLARQRSRSPCALQITGGEVGECKHVVAKSHSGEPN